MHFQRISHQVVVLDGKIYAIGGIGGQYLNTVEEYNPITDIWEIKASMNIARRNFEAVTLGNKIYVLGGNNDANASLVLNSVEEYDPSENEWTIKASMFKKRQNLNV
ncbi:Kelch repeat-containing protein [Fusibacter ferrireducens]|uniref:Uncharacterized protein n=1 Tax=Fusibacter ferrireducens TaxID=2785058 RepID=A0ABR9ZST0_9FIRM|nr:kelch repeat-containing protein [Fusibacter ferrireducens]MBF4693016.1 hypothetical protein [Fusibacter ferrireducens]